MKSICSIFLKFTAFNKDINSTLQVNFLRDQLSFYVDINFHNIDEIIPQLCSMVLEV